MDAPRADCASGIEIDIAWRMSRLAGIHSVLLAAKSVSISFPKGMGRISKKRSSPRRVRISNLMSGWDDPYRADQRHLTEATLCVSQQQASLYAGSS